MEVLIGHARQTRKIHVHGTWPMDGNRYMSPRSWGAVGYNEDQDPSINVSIERGPEVIARDINRRFLPAYRALYMKCLERKTQHDTFRNNTLATARIIAAAAGLPCPQSDGTETQFNMRLYTPQWYGGLTVFEDHVNLDLRSIPTDRALRILALLRESHSEAPITAGTEN